MQAPEPAVDRFCRQVLQLELRLNFPPRNLLRAESTQDEIHHRLFESTHSRYELPARYRLRVLKELLALIEASIDDWEEHGVSEELANALAEAIAAPLPAESDAAQQKSHVTYQLPLLAQARQLSEDAQTITLLEARNLVSAGGTTGLRTWEAALHLGQYLCKLHGSGSDKASMVSGKTVLELGAGTGYLSIMCAKYLGAKEMVATDGSEEVVKVMGENCGLNGLEIGDSTEDEPAGPHSVMVQRLFWGEPFYIDDCANLDLVLGADITYDVSILPNLIDTLNHLAVASPKVEILIAATERYRETWVKFLEGCKSSDFKVESIDYSVPSREEQHGPFYSDTAPIHICKLTKKKKKFGG